MTPVFLTSTYAQKGPGEHSGFEYSRTQNPTRFALEANLAALEGGERWGLAFNAGRAPPSTAVLAHCWTPAITSSPATISTAASYRLFDKVFQRLGLGFTYVDARDAGAVARRHRAARPSLVLGGDADQPAACSWSTSRPSRAACRARRVRLAVDNTFMTPFFQRPLDLGADLVVHSTTKYLNGHSDVVGGAVLGRDPELTARLGFVQNAMGGSQPAFDSFLVLRGTKTLAVRMERHQAQRAAGRRLAGSAPRGRSASSIPASRSHPQHALAQRQMSRLRRHAQLRAARRASGGARRARASFLRALRIFACAESLGGVESLTEHPAIMTHASIPPERRRALGISDGLVRLSVGIEHVDDLIADLETAFA